jgi:L-ascorbate metabolism protein UlaG (beta-lactamase superfamily)
MKVKWLGHASFLITSDDGIRIITDPYITGGDLSYAEITETADIVTVSHDHFDHNNVSSVRGSPEVVRKGTAGVKGISFRSVSSCHDEEGGKLRGGNTIFCFEVSGVGVCHLGDLGHRLSDKQAAEIGPVDVLLIPVGGYFTIDAGTATGVCNRLKPGVVIPMHYKNERCAFPVAGVDEFLKGKEDVSRPDASEAEFKAGELPASTRIIVLKPAL